MQDGAEDPRQATATVTINVLRNFFAPELGPTERSTTISREISEITSIGSAVYVFGAQDRDRRV